MKKGLLLMVFGAICLIINAQSIFVERGQVNDYNEVNTVVTSAQSLKVEELIKSEFLVRKNIENVDIEKLLKKDVFLENAPANSALRYRRPIGYLISGFSTDFYTLTNVNNIIGNAFTNTQWTATTVGTVQNINWLFNKVNTPIASFEYKINNPLINLPFGMYETPVLTGTQNGAALSFQLGEVGQNNFMQLGGDGFWNVGQTALKLFCVGNYDLRYRITGALDMIPAELNEIGQAIDAGNFLGIANVFEKPANRFLIRKFYVRCGDLELYPGKPVTLNVYKRENNGNQTLMATSTATEKDLMKFALPNMGAGSEIKNFYTVPFGFKRVDPETGREEEAYLEIDYTYFVDFTGYKSAIMLAQAEEAPSGQNNAYLVFEKDNFAVSELYDTAAGTPWRTSFLFDMDAIFPFLGTTNDTFKVSLAGGVENFEIYSYWMPDTWQLENDQNLPAWITLGYPSIDQARGLVILPITVAPSSIDRSYTLKLNALACSMTLTISQSKDHVSISEISKEEVNATRQGGDFLLTYPASVTAVAVYNLTGQRIAEYALDASGSYIISASDWSKGIYILKFNEINVSLKVMK